MEGLLRDQFRAYRATLRDDHRQLLERFEPVTVHVTEDNRPMPSFDRSP